MNRRPDSSDAASTTSPRADHSGSSSLGTKYEVFLNFRGPDTRGTFADCLYHFLDRDGVRVFRDNEEIRKGEYIGDELLRAIKASKIYLPIFSADYASSAWCLRELTYMMKCLSEANDKVMLPIFYDVSPKDVKLETPSYLEALEKHKEKFCHDDVEQWKAALTKVARFSGWDLKDKDHGKIIRSVADEVLKKLMKRSRSLPDHLVGIDSHVEAVMNLLNEGSHDIRYLVIWGMGGIGKTTLASVVFNKISNRFEHFSYLSDIRESAKQGRMIDLQKQLLSDLCLGGWAPNSVEAGANIISERFRDKKILLVLDDLDDKDQFSKLAGKSNWFGPGSKIIITTRNINFLPIIEEDESVSSQLHSEEFKFHEMGQMKTFHALRLFSKHAFGMDSPPSDYHDISMAITRSSGGLPLALEVIGSSLWGKGMKTWKEMQRKLSMVLQGDVFQKLKISYDMLEDDQKEIFLDITCYFIGKKISGPYYMWKASGFFPKSDLLVLTRMSLIKTEEDDKLWVHDQLRDLGREIVRRQNTSDPGKRSRLWEPKIASEVIQMKAATANLVALKLQGLSIEHDFTSEEFSELHNLKFLELKGGNLIGDFKNLLSKLTWLSWDFCPSDLRATNLCLGKLVVLELSNSDITEDWAGWGPCLVGGNLKVIRINHCLELRRIPDFSKCSKLRTLKYLSLECCYFFQKLPDSIGELKSLLELDLGGTSLTGLPHTIGGLKMLKKINILRTRIKELPDQIGELESLVELDVTGLSITKLPSSIGKLKRLEILRLNTIRIGLNLKELALAAQERRIVREIGDLPSLRTLELEGSKIRRLPTTMNKLSHLRRLSLWQCHELEQLQELPVSLKELKFSPHLLWTTLNLSYLTNLVDLQILDSDFHLSEVKQEAPKIEWIEGLSNLEALKLIASNVAFPPINLTTLYRLRILAITCVDPQFLKGLPSSLEELRLYDVKSPMERSLLFNLTNLSYLNLDNCCISEVEFDDVLGRQLEKLGTFRVFGGGGMLEKLSVSGLKGLQGLYIHDCDRLMEIQGVEKLESLENLGVTGCGSWKRLPHLSGCTKLRQVRFRGCPQLSPEPRDIANLPEACDLIVNGERISVRSVEDVSNQL